MTNEFDHVVDDGCTSPICPYCDERITEPAEFFGGVPMHSECHRKFGANLMDLDDSVRNKPKIPVTSCPERPNQNDLDYYYGRECRPG